MQGVKHLNHFRSKATESYQRELQNELHHLERRKDRLYSARSRKDDEASELPSPVQKTWVESYQRWDEWQEEEDLQSRIEKTQAKLGRLKPRSSSTRSSNSSTESSSTQSSVKDGMPAAATMCCPSSQFRSAERAVAKMDDRKRLKYMKSFRQDQGNRCFRKKDFVAALKWYEKSILYYEYCLLPPGLERDLLNEERVICLVNSAACHLEMKQYRACIDSCTEALEACGEKNIKALIRRAKAYRFLCKFGAATSDLEKATALIKTNKDAGLFVKALDQESDALRRARQIHECDFKQIAKRMMRV